MSTTSIKHSRYTTFRPYLNEGPWIVIDREAPRYVDGICDSTRQHVASFTTGAAAKRYAAELNRQTAEASR